MFELFKKNKEIKNNNNTNLEKKQSYLSDYFTSCGNNIEINKNLYPWQAFEIAIKNPIVFTANEKITTIASSLKPILLDKEGEIVEEHEVLNFLDNTSSGVTFKEFISEYITNYLITGNNFNKLLIRANRTPLKLENANPTEFSKLGDGLLQRTYSNFYSSTQYIENYKKDEINDYIYYNINNEDIVLQFIRNYNSDPRDFWGFSKLTYLYNTIRSFNESGVSNLALLENGMKPSGVFQFNPSAGERNLSDDQYNRLKCELNSQYGGSNNSGKPILLEGGLEWKEASFTNRDMEWLKGRQYDEKIIYNAFGIPLPLIDTNASTFNNIASSMTAFYQFTIFPLLDKIYGELTNLLLPRDKNRSLYKNTEGYKLTYSKENIESLDMIKTDALLNKVKTGIYTTNELRREINLEDIEGGDELEGRNNQNQNMSFDMSEEKKDETIENLINSLK